MQGSFPIEAGVSNNLSFMGTHTGRFYAVCIVLIAVSQIAASPFA
jgi:hypothetical protein